MKRIIMILLFFVLFISCENLTETKEKPITYTFPSEPTLFYSRDTKWTNWALPLPPSNETIDHSIEPMQILYSLDLLNTVFDRNSNCIFSSNRNTITLYSNENVGVENIFYQFDNETIIVNIKHDEPNSKIWVLYKILIDDENYQYSIQSIDITTRQLQEPIYSSLETIQCLNIDLIEGTAGTLFFLEGNYITKLDIEKNERIQLSEISFFWIANELLIHPQSKKLYFVTSSKITCIDYSGNNITETIPPDEFLDGEAGFQWYYGKLQISIDPINNYIYYADYGPAFMYKSIERLSLITNTVSGIIGFGNTHSADANQNGRLLHFQLFFPPN